MAELITIWICWKDKEKVGILKVGKKYYMVKRKVSKGQYRKLIKFLIARWLIDEGKWNRKNFVNIYKKFWSVGGVIATSSYKKGARLVKRIDAFTCRRILGEAKKVITFERKIFI